MNSRLRQTIADALGLPAEAVHASTSSSSEPRWDSLRHMQLVFALEDVYGIRLRDEEIAHLVSVEAIRAALAERSIDA